jgi:hypothetical protein
MSLRALKNGAAALERFLKTFFLEELEAVPRRTATSPLPATYPEHSEPVGAGVRGRGALSGGSTQGAGAEPSGAKGRGFESFGELPLRSVNFTVTHF